MDPKETTPSNALEAEIRRIETMSLQELRTVWKARWGLAPRVRSVDLLRRLIAWSLQTEAFGDLDDDTQMLLRRTAIPQPTGLPPGSRLTREYRGKLHQVIVGDHTFDYQGTTYRSLSAIARQITGTRRRHCEDMPPGQSLARSMPASRSSMVLVR